MISINVPLNFHYNVRYSSGASRGLVQLDQYAVFSQLDSHD